jgi:hypothetical protein
MANNSRFAQFVVVALVLATMYGCVQLTTKDERACEAWADSLYDAVRSAIDGAAARETSRAGLAAREQLLDSRPTDCSSWTVEGTAKMVCEAWHEDVYAVALDWPLTVPAKKFKSTSATVKGELDAALAHRPYEDCASGWKVQSARDRAHVLIKVPATRVPNGPTSTPKDSSDDRGMLDPSYTGCRAYVEGGRWVDKQGRRYDKIDCTTKTVIG